MDLIYSCSRYKINSWGKPEYGTSICEGFWGGSNKAVVQVLPLLAKAWQMHGHKTCPCFLQEEQGQPLEATSQKWTLTIATNQPPASICSLFYTLPPIETQCLLLFILSIWWLRNCVLFCKFWVSWIKEFKNGLRRKLRDKFIWEKAGHASCETQQLPGGGRWMGGKPCIWVREKSSGNRAGRGMTEDEFGCPERQVQTSLAPCLISEQELGEERGCFFGQA